MPLFPPHAFSLPQRGIYPIQHFGVRLLLRDFPQIADPPGNIHLLWHETLCGLQFEYLLHSGLLSAPAAAAPPHSLIFVSTPLFLTFQANALGQKGPLEVI